LKPNVLITVYPPVWKEEETRNADFLFAFPRLTVYDLNELEKHTLHLLKFNVSISTTVYTKEYFELRDFRKRDIPLKPLKKHALFQLEQRSQMTERELKRKNSQQRRRRKSSDPLNSPLNPLRVVIN